MSVWYFNLIILLVAVGFFCAGVSHGRRHDLFWRLQWIELEHALARLQKREPRDIESIEPNAELSGGGKPPSA